MTQEPGDSQEGDQLVPLADGGKLVPLTDGGIVVSGGGALGVFVGPVPVRRVGRVSATGSGRVARDGRTNDRFVRTGRSVRVYVSAWRRG
ncbi:hypothetical protein, partial [Streptomyces geysiriensis]|uniref:hypothetical protein n=1 Tax=Streptomyces geysiriensis TaxID=68207 RepID=UPI001C7DBD15